MSNDTVAGRVYVGGRKVGKTPAEAVAVLREYVAHRRHLVAG